MKKIIKGDCHKKLPKLEKNSVDAVISDPPYSITSADWDSQPLNWQSLWQELHRVGKPETPFVFTARQPFTTRLVSSNIKNFRHDLVWVKNNPSGALNAKKQPMPKHEDVVVFYREAGKYNSGATPMQNPVMSHRVPSEDRDSIYQKNVSTLQTESGHATSTLRASRNQSTKMKHPTQKPVELMDQLVQMYSDEGDVVLDFSCGSGTTLVSAARLERDYIGFEKQEKYCQIARRRVCQEGKKQDVAKKFFDL